MIKHDYFKLKVIDLQIIGFEIFAMETIRKTHRYKKIFEDTWNPPRHAVRDLKGLPFNPKLHCPARVSVSAMLGFTTTIEGS